MNNILLVIILFHSVHYIGKCMYNTLSPVAVTLQYHTLEKLMMIVIIVIDLLIVCFDRMQMLDGQGILIMTVGNKRVCIYHSFW